MSSSRTIRYLIVLATTFGVLFGPVAHLGALTTMDDDPCAKDCASKSDSKSKEDAPKTEFVNANACGDDCTECNCNSALPSAITPSELLLVSTKGHAQIPPIHARLTPRTSTNIFVPPIA